MLKMHQFVVAFYCDLKMRLLYYYSTSLVASNTGLFVVFDSAVEFFQSFSFRKVPCALQWTAVYSPVQ